MNKLVSVSICLILWSGFVVAEPVLDEDTVKGISAEFTQAIKDADITVFEKYLYAESKITVDLHPSNSAGQTEISYDDYMGMMKMALPFMQDADIQFEVLSIVIDNENNQATIKEKTTAMMDMMGVKIKDVSISETTYGIVDGQIKVLRGFRSAYQQRTCRIVSCRRGDEHPCALSTRAPIRPACRGIVL